MQCPTKGTKATLTTHTDYCTTLHNTLCQTQDEKKQAESSAAHWKGEWIKLYTQHEAQSKQMTKVEGVNELRGERIKSLEEEVAELRTKLRRGDEAEGVEGDEPAPKRVKLDEEA